MKRRWIGWVVALVLAAGVAWGVVAWRRAHKVSPIHYTTAKIDRRRVTGKITATGTLSATITVQVGAQVSGRIAKLYVDYNSPVKKGQLLAQLDPLLFKANVEQANANFLSAQASVDKAVANAAQADRVYQRELALQKESLASQADVDAAETAAETAKADIAVQRASLEQSKAQRDQAKVNLSYTDIHSPIDGTVISRSVDVGQTVAASMTAPVLFTIAEDLRKMQVNTNVAEGDVGRLAAGQDTTFTVDAFPGDKFRGKISQIRNAATTVSNVVTYDAVIDVDNPDLRLRPGMTANVTVVYADEKDVLAVPNTALRFKPPPELGIATAAAAAAAPASGSAAASASAHAGPGTGTGSGGGHRKGNAPAPGEPRPIYVLRGGEPEAVTVKPGLSDGAFTEIVSGDVKEGDDVILDATVEGGAAPASSGSAKRTGGPPRMF